MGVRAFSGGAGCGKTYHLMKSLADYIIEHPLKEGQKVLALTFMHGSRRRLEERLAQNVDLKGKTECATVDSFAWHIVRRWSALSCRLGFENLAIYEHERICDAAGALLEIGDVCSWVAATYPVLLVDEAQDLTVNRLKLVSCLAVKLELLIAADEFQCLKEELRPNPTCSWLEAVCNSKELKQPMRTNDEELLNAAAAIRSGNPPVSGKVFKVVPTANAPLAGTYLVNALGWYGKNRTVAVITPTMKKFATDTLSWAASNSTKHRLGPYKIACEESESQVVERALGLMLLRELNSIPDVIEQLKIINNPRVLTDVTDWMDLQRRTRGLKNFSREDIAAAVQRSFAQKRRSHKVDRSGWSSMTVHGAKNREFDLVILLWPAAVGGSDEQKRRLLYNAVTRAKSQCLVLVQAKRHLQQVPFA